jgi:hypothetical protein
MIVASARGHLGILEVVFPPGLAPRAPERCLCSMSSSYSECTGYAWGYAKNLPFRIVLGDGWPGYKPRFLKTY